MTRSAFPDETVVLAFGSLLMGDDGVGVRALERLARSDALPAAVRLVDAGTSGSSTLADVKGARRLLVLDAIEAGRPPGTVVRVDVEARAAPGGRPTAHELGLAELLDDLRLLGEAPDAVVVLGVQPARLAPGPELSTAADAALGPLVAAAERELRTWADGVTAAPCDEERSP